MTETSKRLKDELKNNYDEIIKKRNETADHIWDKLKDLEEKEGEK